MGEEAFEEISGMGIFCPPGTVSLAMSLASCQLTSTISKGSLLLT